MIVFFMAKNPYFFSYHTMFSLRLQGLTVS